MSVDDSKCTDTAIDSYLDELKRKITSVLRDAEQSCIDMKEIKRDAGKVVAEMKILPSVSSSNGRMLRSSSKTQHSRNYNKNKKVYIPRR